MSTAIHLTVAVALALVVCAGERQQLDECTGIMLQMQTGFHNRMADMVAELHKAVVGKL